MQVLFLFFFSCFLFVSSGDSSCRFVFFGDSVVVFVFLFFLFLLVILPVDLFFW